MLEMETNILVSSGEEELNCTDFSSECLYFANFFVCFRAKVTACCLVFFNFW